jgi:hypothetical protein
MGNKVIPTVPCGHCKGTGTIQLTGVYAETLEILKQQKPFALNGADLAKLAGCSGMSMCNRLIALERFGLAASSKYGVSRLWAAK